MRNHCVDSDGRFASATPSANPATKAPAAINAPGFARMLPLLLSVIAGSADVASFLGLRLFSAHVTGNLVILTTLSGSAGRQSLPRPFPAFHSGERSEI